jgi:hypothetical protein
VGPFELFGPVPEDMIHRIHHMVHMDIFQFIVIHHRVAETGPHMVIKMAIGVFGIEHYAIAIEDQQFKFRHSPVSNYGFGLPHPGSSAGKTLRRKYLVYRKGCGGVK